MAKFKYCTVASDLVIKDLKAVAGTYLDGEVLLPGLADSGGVRHLGTNAATSDGIIGVSNQGETLPAAAILQSPGNPVQNDGATLTGTHALGTIENLKVIINPDVVYGVDYDASSQITTTVGDTTTTFSCTSGVGWDADTLSGGWMWSFLTGALDYIVDSSESSGTQTIVTVTGTDTNSATSIFLNPASSGVSTIVRVGVTGVDIDAGSALAVDEGIVGTDDGAVTGIILENRIESQTFGSEILDPVVHNQEVRFMNSNTAQRDKTIAVAYIKFNHVLNN